MSTIWHLNSSSREGDAVKSCLMNWVGLKSSHRFLRKVMLNSFMLYFILQLLFSICKGFKAFGGRGIRFHWILSCCWKQYCFHLASDLVPSGSDVKASCMVQDCLVHCSKDWRQDCSSQSFLRFRGTKIKPTENFRLIFRFGKPVILRAGWTIHDFPYAKLRQLLSLCR
jgi:hypothetical protein